MSVFFCLDFSEIVTIYKSSRGWETKYTEPSKSVLGEASALLLISDSDLLITAYSIGSFVGVLQGRQDPHLIAVH